MNRIVKLLCVFLCIAPLNAQYYLGAPLTTLSTTVVQFAWDLHDTILKTRTGIIAVKSLKHLGKLSKFKFSRKKKFKDLRREWSRLRKSGATAEVLQQLLEKHGEGKLAKVIEELASQLKPIKGIEELICRLASLGYTQRVATNMGPTFLAKLRRKHHLFSHLEGGITGVYQDGQQLVRKPDAAFYKAYNKQYNPDGNNIVIFIDDKLENVRAAQKAGWIAIHFTSVKQLKKDLQALGIAVVL